MRAAGDVISPFYFSDEELQSGRKEFKYCVQIVGFLTVSVITCYDFSDHTGCSYLFSNDDDAKAFAKALGIRQVEYLNAEGAVESVTPLEGGGSGAERASGRDSFYRPRRMCVLRRLCVHLSFRRNPSGR